MGEMARKAAMEKIKISEAGNKSIMRKITILLVLILLACPLMLFADVTQEKVSAHSPGFKKAETITPDTSEKATSVVTDSAHNVKVVNPQPAGMQGTQQGQPAALPLPAINTSPGPAAPPAPTMPLHPKALLPSGAAIPKNMQQTHQHPNGESGSSSHQPIQAGVPGRTISAQRGNVSLTFDDADIYSVIQTVFGEILKLNYIIDPRVKGRVTFRSVAPVAREKVMPLMEVILRLNGVAIIEESELYRIIPISDLSREPSEIQIGRKILSTELKGKAVLQIVPLNYMQSSDIVKLINPFVSTNAVIVDVPKANHIILADTDANVKRILQMIEYFDSETKEKKGVRVFVHHVQNTSAKDLVAMLQQIYLGAKAQKTDKAGKTVAPSSATPSAAQPTMVSAHSAGTEAIVLETTKIIADEKLNAVVILGTREDYDIIKQTIKELDLIPRQVLIEGMIASIQLTDQMSLGLAWSLKTSLGELNPINISFNPKTLDVNPAKPTSAGLNLIGVDSSNTVRAVINALASDSKAKLLASPHIMVSDNNEARIQVGKQVPIPTSETYGQIGVTPQRTIQYKDIGIILKVKPMINDSGLVNMEISQEISDYSIIKLYSNEDQIMLTKTEATTKLVVKDGQTIVIGGLIQETDKNTKSGLPWLLKIPILGYLFGNTTTDKDRTELVILLTPHIVKNQVDAASVTDRFIGKFKDEKMTQEIQKNVSGRTKTAKEPEKKD